MFIEVSLEGVSRYGEIVQQCDEMVQEVGLHNQMPELCRLEDGCSWSGYAKPISGEGPVPLPMRNDVTQGYQGGEVIRDDPKKLDVACAVCK